MWSVQIHKYCRSLNKNHIFFKDFSFSQLPSIARLTAPIYVLSICEMRIESVEGLRKYRPYKLMLKSVDPLTHGLSPAPR